MFLQPSEEWHHLKPSSLWKHPLCCLVNGECCLRITLKIVSTSDSLKGSERPQTASGYIVRSFLSPLWPWINSSWRQDPEKEERKSWEGLWAFLQPLRLLSSLGSFDSLNRKSLQTRKSCWAFSSSLRRKRQSTTAPLSGPASPQLSPPLPGTCANGTINLSHVHTILEMGHKHLNYLGSIMGTFWLQTVLNFAHSRNNP